MNTRIGLRIDEVTEATGLTRARIYAAAEVMWLGAPAHFIYVDGVIFYHEAGLSQLVQGLDEIGEPVASKALVAVLARLRAEAKPEPVVAERRGYMAELEARQEEDAA